MVELRKSLQSIIKGVHSTVYFNSAPNTATMPYIVFDFPTSINDGALENFVLEVDAWDDSKNTNAIETLMDSVDEVLHKNNIIIPDVAAFVIYRDNRLNPTDDDPRIRRKKYIYQVRTYQKYY